MYIFLLPDGIGLRSASIGRSYGGDSKKALLGIRLAFWDIALSDVGAKYHGLTPVMGVCILQISGMLMPLAMMCGCKLCHIFLIFSITG